MMVLELTSSISADQRWVYHRPADDLLPAPELHPGDRLIFCDPKHPDQPVDFAIVESVHDEHVVVDRHEDFNVEHSAGTRLLVIPVASMEMRAS